jgi:hypothetical protein
MSRPRRVLHVLKFYRPDFTGEGVFLERSSAVMQELAGDVEHEVLATETPGPVRRCSAGGSCATCIASARCISAPMPTGIS